MNILTGIQNFLQFISNNWVTITTIIGLLIIIYRKLKEYLKLSNDEKIVIAKTHIRETILKLVTDAEEDYRTWIKAGAVKRSQVIEEIFLTYPILSKVTNQEELILWIDDTIDEALKTMREIFAEQNLEQSTTQTD